ncbi:MAG: type II toxin-antitoxin system VapB family antitoxin, partial [Treponema sp.]|nr:type II toxin-antitoxin system VapB family antitoxin [Treponema sp.]
MTQVAIDDTLIKNARAVTGIKNDKAIVEEALQSFILDMKTQSEVKQYYG